ncbi:sugar-binding transcriptional regulator [Pelosinus propionicus]|uniref:DNA-binding transcriptional regulator LsrR, DeoR family n=1 Tax=Pelosinus propionicus DSM 13327 TaxID=1123291 RepID=A0A1I4I2B1_9FIRM|nr:sugar-binding transcriptional regulator [Pelosinus propionicus]SFL47896.1 DNA-binding transcriptional regulator LsrR, DeoR family [Pelosinus propionicus DSM 13327]
MQKIVDDSRLIVKCCKLYYEEYYTQNEISNILGVSRPTISRLLKEGRDLGIVKIEIINPFERDFEELERRTEQRFKIREVLIVEDEADEVMQKRQLAKAAAKYLRRIVKDGDTLGISMGTTLKAIAEHINSNEKRKLTFIPLIGGVGQSKIDIHPNDIVMGFAQAFGGNFKLLHAPAVVSNENVKKALLKEQSIKEVIDHSKLCNIGIVGIGSPTDMGSTMMTSGYFNEDDTNEFAQIGVVGDICLQFYDINGNADRFDFNKRVVGINLTDLKEIETVIGVACGEKKVKAIIGALHSKVIDVLITNYSNAVAINDYKNDK